MRNKLKIAAVLAVIGAAGLVAPTAAGAAPTALAAGRYVVELRDGTDGAAVANALGITPRYVYRAAISGFAGDLTTGQLAQLQVNDDVLSLSPDEVRSQVLDTTQDDPPAWGIDRIDQRFLPLSTDYTHWYNGTGTRVYVIDSGIDKDHPEFGTRVQWMYNAIDANNTDCNGHGTHVAGTVGSASYGVAKNVYLRAVKVINCGGGSNLAALIAGIDWVTEHAIKPAVANTSWNWSANAALENALKEMIASGVYLVASAGNTGDDSCDRLPRKIPAAMVVANSTGTDARSASSSIGACVDIYAPGSSIQSTLPGGGSGPKSGTSMSAPHVAGIAALHKDAFGDPSQAALNAWMVGCATPGALVGDLMGTPNRLANTCGL